MYVTDFEEFYSWLIEQKANGQWEKFSKFLENRIGVEKDTVMMHLASLSRENKAVINSLIESKAILTLLEEIKDLPSTDASDLAKMAGVPTD